jgi:hypothetical protein
VSAAAGVCVLYVLDMALDGVGWVRSGSVEIAVGPMAACYSIGAVICSLPWTSLHSGARFDFCLVRVVV